MSFANIVELDVNAFRDEFGRNAKRFGELEDFLRGGAEDVERASNVKDLEGDDEDAELQRSHGDLEYKKNVVTDAFVRIE